LSAKKVAARGGTLVSKIEQSVYRKRKAEVFRLRERARVVAKSLADPPSGTTVTELGKLSTRAREIRSARGKNKKIWMTRGDETTRAGLRGSRKRRHREVAEIKISRVNRTKEIKSARNLRIPRGKKP